MFRTLTLSAAALAVAAPAFAGSLDAPVAVAAPTAPVAVLTPAPVAAPSDWTGWAAVDTMNSLFTDAPVADSGLGWQLVDKQNNLPPSGPFVPDVDFKAIYKKAWGV